MGNGNDLDDINVIGYENYEENEHNSCMEYGTDSNRSLLATILENDKELNEDNISKNDYMSNCEEKDNSLMKEKMNEKYNNIFYNSQIDGTEIFNKESNFNKQNLLLTNLDARTRASTVKTQRDVQQKITINTYPNEIYDGEVDENYVRNGYGIYQYHNGDIYEGDYQNGTRNGEGEYTYNDGSIYRGHWLNDKKHGRGTFKFDKYEFDGEWENDCLKEGFTYKINQFDQFNSFNSEDFFENSEINHDSCSGISEESLNLDHNKMDDPAYLRNFVNDNYRILNQEKFKIDIELLNVKSRDLQLNLINNLPIDKLSTKFNFKNVENFTNNHSSIKHLNSDINFERCFDKTNLDFNYEKLGKNSHEFEISSIIDDFPTI